jgi:hypothetical protein
MTPTRENLTRRAAVERMAGLLLLAVPGAWRLPFDPFPHPDPRPGITAENVWPDAKLPDKKRVRAAFAAARAHPELFDGIYCACECSKHHRSLLTCFESAQPTGCYGCIEVAELVDRMAKDGKTLAEIRAACDKEWG